MFKLMNPIWHPWMETGQEQALDLSVKKEECAQKQFDFDKFYKTYNQIAERNQIVTLNYEQSFYPQNVKFDKKRKIPSSFSERVRIKQVKQEADNKPENTDTHLLKYQSNSSKIYQLKQSKENVFKNYKKKDSDKVTSIKDSCDCRFCYEDHIIRMRLKNTHPFL